VTLFQMPSQGTGSFCLITLVSYKIFTLPNLQKIDMSTYRISFIIGMTLMIQFRIQAQVTMTTIKTPDTAKTSLQVISSIKPYNQVITARARTSIGLFTVHKVDEKYYFEIPDSILNREILAVTRFSKTPGGSSLYGGYLANNQTLEFEKGNSRNIFVRVVTLIGMSDSSQAISKSVSSSNMNTIAVAFPIMAYNKDSSAIVIEVTDFFKGDNQVVCLTPSMKKGLSLTALMADRSFIQSINTYPIYIDINTVKTLISGQS
jgi:hypothetical protein